MQNEKKAPKKSKRIIGSIVLYVAASVVALIAVALLVNNILLFRNIVNQYTTQGYAAEEVIKQLLTSQLLPEIFKSVALYGGIAGLLMGLGMIYQKVAEYTSLQDTFEFESDNACDMAMEDNPVEIGDTEVTGQIEAVEEDSENK